MKRIPWGGQGGGSADPALPPPMTSGGGGSTTRATKKRGPYKPRLKGKEGAMSSSVDNPRRNAMLSTIAGGGESSIGRKKGKGKPLGTGAIVPHEGQGRLLSDPKLIDPASNKKQLTPTRSYTVEATAFLDIVSQVHNRDTHCPANITSDESGAERCDIFNLNCWCKDCGMQFPRLKVAATPISSVVFGILMAGSNIENYCAAHNFSDIADMSRTTYYRELPKVLDAVGQVFDEVMEGQREDFRNQGWRDVWVDTDTLYFSQHKKELEARGDAFAGIEEGRYENSTPEDMAVGLLLTRKARNNLPAFTEIAGKTLMKGIEVAVDGSYCSRNDMTYLCNVVLSAERSAPDAQDRVTVPFDMVTLSRRTHKDAPLKEVCSLLRDGLTCFAHGSEAEWRKKVTKGTERETYEALNVNCYSSSGIRHSLGGQAAEPQGGRLLCLRLLLSGFYITRFKVANDVGNEMGNVFREFFTEAVELLDWAHVQRDLRCDVAKVAPGNGDRIGRDFGRAVTEALAESKEEGGLPWENGFVRKFAHITSHFQGDHQYCGKACEEGSAYLDPETGGVASGGWRAEGVRGKGKGGAAGKISLGDCGKSSLTIASARASTEDARDHFEAKQRRMDEFLSCVEEQLQLTTPEPVEVARSLSALRGSILFAREKCTEGWSLCNGLVESLEEALCVLEPAVSQASDRARSILPLSALARIQGNVEGLHSWELPGKEGEMGYQETDGPAYLVTRPDIQEAKLSYMEAVDAVAQAELLYRAHSKEELAVPVHYMDQTRMGIMQQELWCEGQSWSFFSHCSSAEGHTQRQDNPCQACDLQIIVQVCLARAFCFCTTSGTHSLDSLNASVSAMTTKKGDFSRSDFAHAQIAVLKRVHPRGQVGLAADVRRKLHLPGLSESAAKRVRAREESYTHSKRGEKAGRAPTRAATGEDLKRRRQSGVKKGKAAVQEAIELNHRAALAGSLAPAGRGKMVERGEPDIYGLAAGVPAGQEEGEGGRGGGADGGGGGQVSKRRSKSAATRHASDGGGGSAGGMLDIGVAGGGVGAGGWGGAVGEPPRKNAAFGEAPQRLCQTCLGNGVSRSFLAEKAHKRKSQHCEEVQRTWDELGGNGA